MPFYYEYKKVIPLNFSASLSYYLVLSLVPSFLLIYLIAFYFLKDLLVIEEIIRVVLPSSYSDELIIFLKEGEFKLSFSLFISIGICINIISNGILNLSQSINQIFNYKEKKNIKIKSIMLSLFLVLLEGMLLYIASIVNNYLSIFTYLRFLILVLIILFAFIFIFKYLPSNPFKIKEVLNYSVIGSFIISLFIFGFEIYLDYYSRMESIYGPFSILVSILILFKLISNIISIIFFFIYKKMKKSSLI